MSIAVVDCFEDVGAVVVTKYVRWKPGSTLGYLWALMAAGASLLLGETG